MSPDSRENPRALVEPGAGVATGGGRRPGQVRAVLRRMVVAVRGRRTRVGFGVLAVALAGMVLGSALTPALPVHAGPLQFTVRVVPSAAPGVHLLLPPAGEVSFSTHRAPVAVEAGISEVDLDQARALIESPERLKRLQAQAPDELRAATVTAGTLSAAVALACSVGLSVLVYRTQWRRTGQVAATTTAVLCLTTLLTVVTFDSDRFAQPRFDGLLSQAPYVANQTSGVAERLESYRSGLADLVRSVATLYGTTPDLPVIDGGQGDFITVLHVSDLHLNPLGFDLTRRLVQQFRADVVVDTGDITTWGTEVESAVLDRIRHAGAPYVFVRGNHDSIRTQEAVAAVPNAVVLDGRAVEVAGLVFAGLGDPRFTPDDAGSGGAADAAVSGRRLVRVVQDWNDRNPGRPVAVAAFHEPAGTPPLDGVVPLVLSGHLHERSTRTSPAGTRFMVQGSTGGAGFAGLTRDRDEPVPLTATVLYFARSGERAGTLLAYDEVTVGGFGLASVALQRSVVRPEDTSSPTACVTGPSEPPQTPNATNRRAAPGAVGRCETVGTSTWWRNIRPASSRVSSGP